MNLFLSLLILSKLSTFRIEANSYGHGLNELFGRFMDDRVTKVKVEDPYIRAHHQIINFLRLCELCYK